MKCCMDPVTQISPVQDGPQRPPPGLTQHSALRSLTERRALVQGRCHECVAFPHHAETTICQPGPLQHLNTDRRDSNTTCPGGYTNHEILGSLYCCQCRQQTQYMKHMHGVKMQARHVAVMGNVTNCKQDMLTHTHYTSTPHLYSPQHSMKETQTH